MRNKNAFLKENFEEFSHNILFSIHFLIMHKGSGNIE